MWLSLSLSALLLLLLSAPGAGEPDGDAAGDPAPKDPKCAYKVLVNGRGAGSSGRVCFRTRDSGFLCNRRDCRVSVFLQWRPSSLLNLRGFRLNCTWSGIYTKFQCDNVELGLSCRDYLVGEVHDSVEYRICLQSVYGNGSGSRVEEDCLQFVVEPAGMQDIVIAMTAVGGSICVMLVIICLLVAYITEKIMHPAFGRPSSSSSRNGHCERSVIT
uniref:Fibronectin type III domain containing 10 n=1 Tax=Callorhinchus milii TaxID=7868 RepID=A0A4W3IYA6_CALMI